jgi:DNA-binding CsgD family transcriptional regulator
VRQRTSQTELTDLERRVASLADQGLMRGEIAERMGVGVHVVDDARRRIRQKTQRLAAEQRRTEE